MRTRSTAGQGSATRILAFLAATLLLGASSALASEVTLRFASYNPPRGMEAELSDWFMDEVTKQTAGQVKFEKYYGGALLQARETLRGVQAGTADLGFLFVPYFPKELVAWTAGEAFLLGPVDPKRRADLFWQMFQELPQLESQLAEWNQKLVAIHVFGDHSVGGPRPITKLEDLKGLKVRCAGGFDSMHMGALGANVVFLKGTEVYSAMEKGAIDANYTPVTSYYKYKLPEIGKNHHLLVIPQFVGSVGLITMNLDRWKALPEDAKKVIAEAGRKYAEVAAEKIRALEAEYTEKMKASGVTVTRASLTDVQTWAAAAAEASKQKWIQDAEAVGFSGRELMDKVEALVRNHAL